LSIRIKLIIGVLLASIIPFLFVSIFAVVYFQSDKEADIIRKLNSDLGVQTRFLKSNLQDTKDMVERLGMQNYTTKDALDKFFQSPPVSEDDMMRSIVTEQYTAFFKQNLKGDVFRIMLVMNGIDKDDQVIGEVVYSITRRLKDGKLEMVEDSLELKRKLKGSLLLRDQKANALAQVYFTGRDQNRPMLHEFNVFDDQYSFYITAPILQPGGFELHLPYIDRSGETKPAKDNMMGMVLVQILPDSMKDTIGDYYGLGETYLVGENAQAQKVLHSSVSQLQSKNGQSLQPGDSVPEYVIKALS